MLKKNILMCMLHSQTMNNKINVFHELSLRIVCSDQSSTSEELLEGEKTFSIHPKNIQRLAIETYKFVNVLSQDIMSNMFHLKKKTDIV